MTIEKGVKRLSDRPKVTARGDRQTDVVLIGSGIGGLSCAALLARYGFEVTVCESHSIPGGAAHAFERNGFKFDSGPSLYSGLSYSPSANPLRQVLLWQFRLLLCAWIWRQRSRLVDLCKVTVGHRLEVDSGTPIIVGSSNDECCPQG